MSCMTGQEPAWNQRGRYQANVVLRAPGEVCRSAARYHVIPGTAGRPAECQAASHHGVADNNMCGVLLYSPAAIGSMHAGVVKLRCR